jgi:hypothetical protein
VARGAIALPETGCANTRPSACRTLERPTVIVTDLGGVANTKREVRLHIAITRPLDLVSVVGEGATVRQDPVLGELLKA